MIWLSVYFSVRLLVPSLRPLFCTDTLWSLCMWFLQKDFKKCNDKWFTLLLLPNEMGRYRNDGRWRRVGGKPCLRRCRNSRVLFPGNRISSCFRYKRVVTNPIISILPPSKICLLFCTCVLLGGDTGKRKLLEDLHWILMKAWCSALNGDMNVCSSYT